MPRPCPGAGCCAGDDSDCSLRCLFKCIGTASELPGERCPFPCGVRINMPVPNVIDPLSGPDCPPAGPGCEAHPCNDCYAWDQIFYTLTASFGETFYDWVLVEGPDVNDCTNLFWVYRDNAERSCWSRFNAECPDTIPSEDWPLACDSEILVVEREVKINVQWDGSCGFIEVELKIVVRLRECLLEVGVPEAETTHTYTFRRDWCNCTDLIGALSYVGTTAVDNERGIRVPDPCALNSAAVTLESDVEYCPTCPCFECEPITQVAITGPTINATFQTFRDNTMNGCDFWIHLPEECTVLGVEFDLKFRIECLSCEHYRILVGPYGEDIIGPFQCGDTLTLTFASDYSYHECLRGHTLTLS